MDAAGMSDLRDARYDRRMSEKAHLDAVRFERVANATPVLDLEWGNRRTECDRVEAQESVTEYDGVLGRYVCQVESGHGDWKATTKYDGRYEYRHFRRMCSRSSSAVSALSSSLSMGFRFSMLAESSEPNQLLKEGSGGKLKA